MNPLETNLTENRQKIPKKPRFSTRFLPPRSRMWLNLSETFMGRSRDDDERADTKNLSYKSLVRPVRGNIRTRTQTRRHEDGEFYILDLQIPLVIITKYY